MNKTATQTPKVKKSDQAIEIFKRHLPNRETVDRHAFREAVISDFKKEISVKNSGTLGMYFSWCDKQVTGRKAKQYNRTAGRRSSNRDAVDANGKTESQNLNELANQVFRDAAKAAAKSVAGKAASPIVAADAKRASTTKRTTAAAKKVTS